jgi:3-polyprenyl-4-hydroxybenzoate decarboxylase
MSLSHIGGSLNTVAACENSLQANFHEKAHFVKADVAASSRSSSTASALRAMLPSALSVSPLSSVALCIMRSVLIRATNKALQSSERSLLLAEGRPSSQLRSRLMLEIRSDGARSRGGYSALRSTLWQATSSPSLASLCFCFLLPLSRLAS